MSGVRLDGAMSTEHEQGPRDWWRRAAGVCLVVFVAALAVTVGGAEADQSLGATVVVSGVAALFFWSRRRR